MFKGAMRRGLFNRLVQAGVPGPFAIVLAEANYPNKKEPLPKPPVIPQRLIWQYTEQFVDKGEIDANTLFRYVFGCGADEYYEGAG